MGSYANHAEAMTDIAEHIVGFYKSVRLHSKPGNLPPNAFAAIGIQTSYRCVRKNLANTQFLHLVSLGALCVKTAARGDIEDSVCFSESGLQHGDSLMWRKNRSVQWRSWALLAERREPFFKLEISWLAIILSMPPLESRHTKNNPREGAYARKSRGGKCA